MDPSDDSNIETDPDVVAMALIPPLDPDDPDAPDDDATLEHEHDAPLDDPDVTPEV
jgi:hypothetical protein